MDRAITAKLRADAEITRLANRDSDEEWEKLHESDSDEDIVRFKAAARKKGKKSVAGGNEKREPKWKVMNAEDITQKFPIAAVTARGRTLVTGVFCIITKML